KYSFAFALGYILSVFAGLGIGIIIIKDVSRNKELMDKYFSGLLSLNLLLSLAVYFIIIIITVFLSYSTLYKWVILIACLSIILDGISGYCLAYFQADEGMEYVSISKILQTLIVFIFGGLFLYIGKSLIWFVSAFLISSIITLIFIFIFVILKLVKFEIRFDIKLWKKILKASIPLALFGLFGVIYFRIDTLMLAFLKGDVEVGIYNSAFQIVSALLFIPGVFLTAIFPLLSSQYKNMKDSFLRTTNLALKIIVILAIPIAFGIAVLAKRIIPIIYTPEYISAVLPLQILAFVMMFMFMNYLFYSIINSIDRQDVIPKIMGICMIINIILNYFFIIKFDTFGAALATLISNGI
ncbi:MAG: flippase, partial [Nanoarchaeota archaeon]|nr:flippase [Nanoarchaeota archaeon]